jgi:hypothetical protein
VTRRNEKPSYDDVKRGGLGQNDVQQHAASQQRSVDSAATAVLGTRPVPDTSATLRNKSLSPTSSTSLDSSAKPADEAHAGSIDPAEPATGRKRRAAALKSDASRKEWLKDGVLEQRHVRARAAAETSSQAGAVKPGLGHARAMAQPVPVRGGGATAAQPTIISMDDILSVLNLPLASAAKALGASPARLLSAVQPAQEWPHRAAARFTTLVQAYKEVW